MGPAAGPVLASGVAVAGAAGGAKGLAWPGPAADAAGFQGLRPVLPLETGVCAILSCQPCLLALAFPAFPAFPAFETTTTEPTRNAIEPAAMIKLRRKVAGTPAGSLSTWVVRTPSAMLPGALPVLASRNHNHRP